jgi:uncharacterized MAPEG superfamily protein
MFVSITLLTAGALVFASAAIQHLNTVSSRGVGFIFTDRATPLDREGFAGRAARTLQNNLESMGMVTPAGLVLLLADADGMVVTGAALVYALTRTGFTLSYWAGINKMRSLFWGIGMAMIAVLTINAMLVVVTR